MTGSPLSRARAPRRRPRWRSTCVDAGVAQLKRSIFYLRPNLFFVFDYVAKQREQHQVKPQLNFHFPEKPGISKTNRELTVTNGRGRLDMISVFPAESITRIRANKDSGALVSGWHFTVTDANEGALHQRYLHVFRAEDSRSRLSFPNYGAITGSGVHGVWIEDPGFEQGARRVAVVFSDDGAAAQPRGLEYERTDVDRHYILNLTPAKNYTLTKSGISGRNTIHIRENSSGEVRSSSTGVLVFSR